MESQSLSYSDSLALSQTDFTLNLKEFNCVEHPLKKLDIICIDKLCENQGIFCSHCFFKTHYCHKSIPLDIFLENLNKSKEKFYNQVFLLQKKNQNIIEIIKKSAEKFVEQTKNFVDEFINFNMEENFCFNKLINDKINKFNSIINSILKDQNISRNQFSGLLSNLIEKIYFAFEDEELYFNFDKHFKLIDSLNQILVF